MSSKILTHPDKDLIIEKLTNGTSVKKVEEWLKEQYPNDKSKQITFVTLQQFRKERLNLNKKTLNKIKELGVLGLTHGASKKEISDAKVQAILNITPSYRAKLNEVTELQLDVPRKILELDRLVSTRIEHYYDKVSNSKKDDPSSDRILIEYLRQMSSLYQDWKKLIDGVKLQTDDDSVNLNIVKEQIGIIREAVRELLNELDPAIAIDFLDRLNVKLNAIEYRHRPVDIFEQSNKLNSKIIEFQERDCELTVDELPPILPGENVE